MTDRWLIVSSTGADWEAWIARPPDDDPNLGAWFRAVMDEVRPLVPVWDWCHPAAVETWPEMAEVYREKYGWAR